MRRKNKYFIAAEIPKDLGELIRLFGLAKNKSTSHVLRISLQEFANKNKLNKQRLIGKILERMESDYKLQVLQKGADPDLHFTPSGFIREWGERLSRRVGEELSDEIIKRYGEIEN